MILGREFGSKTGGGGASSKQDEEIARRERLKKIALETIDLKSDPYMIRNHLGQYECKLCLTIHSSVDNYLVHTQGKKHTHNLGKLEWKEKQKQKNNPNPQPLEGARPNAVTGKKVIKIGRPGYKVTKQVDPVSSQKSMIFEVFYPEITENVKPQHRMMSCFEQRKEPADKKFQYLLFAAEPYETIAFKIPNETIDKSNDKWKVTWDSDKKRYELLMHFKVEQSS
eukprot:TRINITY_DN401_c0_g1_i1.p1 TRINITY_DN401_c0_g1~~TRINITY_DN401_c0_g1_i1.p1  ORF type:complete len:225 (-),score=58.66 TRINITY_DN401_c0_g1_i1:140-814(-)